MSEAPLPNVAIVGRPNVGKSALFNRVAGRKIAIVHDQPGVTRDRLSTICRQGDRPFAIWDTGGIGGAGESELRSHVRRMVAEAINQSDVLLLMVDGQHGVSPIDQDLARLVRKSGKPVVLVVNKIDDPKHEDLSGEFESLGFDTTISISAAHGRGISGLVDAIERLLPTAAAVLQRADSTIPHPVEPEPRQLPIAIVGRPNVGKSSLINAIIKDQRAIVSELPGTTRDAVDISYQRNADRFTFIDTAGIRKRGKHSTSVEVFSVMRSERSIRRAELCVLVVDVTTNVTAQDKKIGGLIQESRKAAIVVLNKFDLLKPARGVRQSIEEFVEEARRRLFFLDYAPVLVASAATGEHVDKLFRLVKKVQSASHCRIGTGVLNRALRAAFAANPPPMSSGRRLKLFYATQTSGSDQTSRIAPPEFVLFVNEPRLLLQTYRRYLEAQIRQVEPYEGLPIILTCRPRTEKKL